MNGTERSNLVRRYFQGIFAFERPVKILGAAFLRDTLQKRYSLQCRASSRRLMEEQVFTEQRGTRCLNIFAHLA